MQAAPVASSRPIELPLQTTPTYNWGVITRRHGDLPMTLHRTKQREAFTVPEILAVVAIIVIILSLLLPSFQASREYARNVVCMSQQRQLGLAMLGFASDNQLALPGCYLPPYSGTEVAKRSWMGKEAFFAVTYEGAVVQYLGGSTQGGAGDAIAATPLSPAAQVARKLYRCPSLPTGPTLGGSVGSNGLFDYTGLLVFTGAKKTKIPSTSTWTDPGNSAVNTAPTPIIVEEDPAAYVNGCCVDPGHSNIDRTGTWHFGGGNYIAIDAHSVRLQPVTSLGPTTHMWSAKAPSGATVGLTAHTSGFGGWNTR